jgi:hypothetical protein
MNKIGMCEILPVDEGKHGDEVPQEPRNFEKLRRVEREVYNTERLLPPYSWI